MNANAPHPAFQAGVTVGNITEYVVVVEGKGFVERTIPALALSETGLIMFEFDEADELARKVKGFLTANLQSPELADAVRILSRNVHVRKSEWKPSIRVVTTT